jgi:hypothetical protein
VSPIPCASHRLLPSRRDPPDLSGPGPRRGFDYFFLRIGTHSNFDFSNAMHKKILNPYDFVQCGFSDEAWIPFRFVNA